MKLYGNISIEWAKVLYFVWEKALFYRELSFLIDSLLGNVFLNFKNHKLNNATVCETPMLNISKLPEKVISSLTVHRKPSLHNFHVISVF